MQPITNERMFEALLTVLISRAGGWIVVPLAEIARCSRDYRFDVRGDRETQTMTIMVRHQNP